jgi:hypothetical protein
MKYAKHVSHGGDKKCILHFIGKRPIDETKSEGKTLGNKMKHCEVGQ